MRNLLGRRQLLLFGLGAIGAGGVAALWHGFGQASPAPSNIANVPAPALPKRFNEYLRKRL